MNSSIDALNSEILKAYGGALQGDDANGVWDVEFPNIRRAAAWANTCDVSPRVSLRDDSSSRTFADPIVVQFRQYS